MSRRDRAGVPGPAHHTQQPTQADHDRAAPPIPALVVARNVDDLQTVTHHSELYGFAVLHELNTPALFPQFKAALRAIGIDYDYLAENSRSHDRAAEALARAVEGGPALWLWSAADAEADRFAVCGDEGLALWYGHFHTEDWDHPTGDHAVAEMAAAQRAVWLAGWARLHYRLDAATLHLAVGAPVDAEVLGRIATWSHLALELEVNAEDNAALDWCSRTGRRSWDRGTLVGLIGDHGGSAA